MLTRSIDLEVKAASDGKITGHGSTFGNKDSYGDVVEAGAFTASLAAWKQKGRLPPMLWSHDQQRPVGVWEKVTEDSKGLAVEGRLALGTAAGREAHELAGMGAVSGLSIGYSIPPGGAEWDRKASVNRLRKVDLWEVSLVALPANDAARIESVRSALVSARDCERLLREAGFSKSQARALLSGGFAALASADDDAELLEALRRRGEALR